MLILLKIMRKLGRFYDQGLVTVLAWSLLLNLLFGVAFYFAERNVREGLTLVDSIWWSMVTMTTVGYGDFYAQTLVGRFLISYPCMILGIGIIGYLVGLVANWLIDMASKKRKGEMDITFKDHIIICNYPSKEKILTIARELHGVLRLKKARLVLVTESIDELPKALTENKIHFVQGNPTIEDVLFQANVLHCAGVIVLAENPADPRSDERTYTIGSIIEHISVEKRQPIKTIVELVGNRSVRNLERAAVDGMISGEDLIGCLLVQEFLNPGVNRVINQMISNTVGSQLYIHETRLTDYSIHSLQMGVLRHEANIQVIGIIQEGGQVLNPPKDLKIKQGDQLIVLAENLHDLGKIEADILADPNLTAEAVR